MSEKFSATCLGTVLYTDLPCTMPVVGQRVMLQGIWSLAGTYLRLVTSAGLVKDWWWRFRG